MNPEEPVAPKPKLRLTSLDAFRGLTIIGMLIVNNIALDTLTPKTLTHAEWTGAVHIADVVFPWFLFAVGIALPFSLASQLKKGMTKSRFILKAASRAAILIGLGILVDSSVERHWAIGLGVLQLIGLSSLFGSVLIMIPRLWRLVCALAFITVHFIVLRHLPIPGAAAGTFTEDVNSIKFLNDTYLEPWHLRGLLSVLTTGPLVAIASVFGDFLLQGERRRWLDMLLGGVAMIVVGQLTGFLVPMNKPLWTGSYVLFTGGMAALMLAAMHLLFDHEQRQKWALPFLVFGSNAILAYVAPIFFKTLVLRSITTSSGNMEDAMQLWSKQSLGVLGGGLMYTGVYILFWWVLLFFLYRKRVFVRV